jgi:pyrimidine-nucleoside phosphorylase
MKTLDDARILAEQMVDLGRREGREVVCLLTDMDQPLGSAVGNALEVREAVETVTGHGPADFTELVLDACARLLALSDLGVDVTEGRLRAQQAIADGAALRSYEAWIRAQGGDADPAALPRAPVVREISATRAGIVTSLDPLAVGGAALELGGGRRTKEDEIDHAVGVVCHVKRGDRVARGHLLADVHARSEESADEAVTAVLHAYEIGDTAPHASSILLDVIE